MSKRRSRKWLTVLLALAFFFVALAVILSRVVASQSARQHLTSRLEQAFGRPVEVNRFSIRWIPTPGIVAERVTIGEDPRFGHEFFLRADSIIASPRWRSLFLAKLELGTLELSHPSLNLVRNDDGRWNVESWLPPPESLRAVQSISGPQPLRAAQLSRIEVDSGRINFSQGADRRAFALEDLSGSIEQESAGRWRVALAAHPSRATVHLQSSGTLSVAGYVSGTSARLHPADLTLSWSDASLADALRLALGYDPGVRGVFGIQVNAHTEPESAPLDGNSAPASARWNISLTAHTSGLHRWDMSARADNPAANFAAEAEWDAGSPQISLRTISLQAPHSNIEAAGTVDWAAGINPEVHVTSSGISFEDIFAWYRSFQPGIGDGLTAEGFLTSDVKLSGWPVRARDGTLSSEGATVRSSGVTIAKSGAIEARLDPGAIEILPIIWTIANSAAPQNVAAATIGEPRVASGTISFRAKLFSAVAPSGKSPAKWAAKPISRTADSAAWNYELALRGDFTHFEDFLNAARLIGRPLNAGWQVEGGLTANLQWQGIVHQRFPKATGDVSPRAMTLKLPLLNQSVEIENARIELRPNEPRVAIVKATALGANWQGTIWRSSVASPSNNGAAPEWQFDLSADHLDAVELDRWIGPRARPNWIARIFTSSGNAPVQIPGPGPLSQLRARGVLHADTFTLAPLEVQSLRAQIEMAGRNVNVSEFEGKLNDGTISGGLRASLEADPNYWLHISVKNVSVTELAKSNGDLRDHLTGQLSGEVKLSLHGIGREQLSNTLKGEGHISATRLGIRGVDLSAPTTEDAAHSSTEERFPLANADISVDARKINFRKIALVASNGMFDGKGTSDFARAIQIDFWRPPQTAALARVDIHSANKFIRVSGTLEAPHVSVELFPAGATLPEPAVVRH